MTETILTDDDVAALEALESGSGLTDDQVGRLQTLENTPFFADSIKQGESKGQRFTGAGFTADGGYVSADPASPIVQAQQDPVPPVQGPARGEDEPAPQQPPEDGMQFNLVTPPPMYVEERETNIRGPRLGAMGPAMESGEFYADDEELLDALRSAPAQGRVLTADEHRTMLELEEKESDKLGALKSGAGMMAAGLWEMAKGIAVEQGITAPGAIGQALSSAVFDPANAASILKQGMVTATNRAVQGELTKVEGMRKGYIGMRQIWSWFNGFIENDQIATDQRQAVMADLRQTGAFGADNVANAQLVEQETAKRREQGLAPFAPTDRTQEFETKYQRYLENEKLNRAYTGQNQYLMGEQVVNERPGIVADQLVTAFNPITGQSVEPLPYTSMGYGMMYQLDTYVGFGAGYISKARVASRAAAAARPLFSFAEKTATKAADVAKTGRDAHKIFTMSNIASGGALATGVGMQFNQSTGDFGKALMFFGAIKPTMRAAGFVFKKVPGGSKAMEAAGVFRPQALRIIAEESKAGPLGAGATAQTPATQAAAIRAARPEAAQRLVNRGSVPDRYARFMGTRTTRAGDVKLSAPGSRGFDSTLKRVAQNPENPPNVRRAARAADEIGLTQAFRTTDDAISGALAGLVGSSPFAAIAPDDQTAGGILAVGTAFGAAGGIAGGVTSFKGDAVDADIARFMVDTEAYGGDPQALFQIPRRDLAAMAALQSMSVNKGVDFVALRTEDYWLNVPEAKGAQGYFAAGTAKDGSTPGRMRLFVDLGHSVVQEGGIAKVVKASDGMYELTVVRPDGKVMYPAPASDGSQPVIRRKSSNDFNVKDGDPVSPYSPLNRQPPRIVTSAHEFMHALMNSDMFGGDHQGALRGLIYDQYKPETINSMAREYAQRLVDAQINNGAVPKPTNDDAKAKMIDDMMIELSDDSVARTGDQRAWIADEILAETWQDVAQTTDINRMRQGKSADGRLTDAARSIMVATTRALETFGMKFDWATGKPLSNPSAVFRDNPLANNPLIRKRLLESVRNYDRYLTLLEDAGAVESKGSPLPRSGKASDWAADGTMRTHDMGGGIKENDVMIVDPDGQVRWKLQDQIDNEYRGRQTGIKDLLKRLGTRKVGQNDPTFGLRDAGPLRTIYSGAELPMENSALGYPPVLASFPKWYREMYMDTILPAQRAGETVRFSNNTVGTRSDQGGPYKLKQLISSGFAKQSEGVPFGVQITKSGNHINIEIIDLNSFKAAALKAINDGKISYFNNDYKQVVAGLKQLMDNYRNKRDGSYMIGEEGKNILNGLLYGKSRANQGYGAMLNPRGSIRTYRMDRMNWMERTGDNGYFFDNDRAKNNRMPETEPVDGPNNNRMPSALPQAGMAMPDADLPFDRYGTPSRLFRGTEPGRPELTLRESADGEMGRAFYLTPQQWLAETYGGGPKASVKDGTRIVRGYDFTRSIGPEDVAYLEGGSTGMDDAVLRSGVGFEIWRGKISAKKDEAPNRAAMNKAAREAGVKMIVGNDDSVAINQVAVLDKSILGNPRKATGGTRGQAMPDSDFPIRGFHGGPKGITRLKGSTPWARKKGGSDGVIYISTDQAGAEYYADLRDDGRVYEVSARADNPYFTSDQDLLIDPSQEDVRRLKALGHDAIFPADPKSTLRAFFNEDQVRLKPAARGQAMPDVGSFDEDAGAYLIAAGDGESLPVYQQADKRGKPAVDGTGKAKFVPIDYDLLHGPGITKYTGPGPEDTTKPNYKGLAYDITQKGQREIDAAIDSGAVDSAANRVVDFTVEAMKNPEIAAGKGWYSRMRDKLLSAFGEKGRELFAQLLGATSAKTPVEPNFLQAFDAFEGINAGRYDRHRKAYLDMLEAEDGNNLTAVIVERGYTNKVRAVADSLSKEARKLKGKKKAEVLFKAGKLRDLAKKPASQWTRKDRFDITILAEDILPLRSNGKKFNSNSHAVLKVIAGTWLNNRKSPKTPNFAGNLTGRTLQATIDVWAARHLRELLYGGSNEPWRIQPRSEVGVNPQDFALGQIIMQRAAKKLDMNPDDLQAILWFAEKNKWDANGWTGTEGANKSSFDTTFDRAFPSGQKPLTFQEVSKILSEEE